MRPCTPPLDSPLDPAERALLAQLRAQALAFLAGARAPAEAWLLANYLDLAQVCASERRTEAYRRALAWLERWAQQRQNARELERLAARSWVLGQWHERRLSVAEAADEAKLRSALAQRKRPFVNASDEMAFAARRMRAGASQNAPARGLARYGT